MSLLVDDAELAGLGVNRAVRCGPRRAEVRPELPANDCMHRNVGVPDWQEQADHRPSAARRSSAPLRGWAAVIAIGVARHRLLRTHGSLRCTCRSTGARRGVNPPIDPTLAFARAEAHPSPAIDQMALSADSTYAICASDVDPQRDRAAGPNLVTPLAAPAEVAVIDLDTSAWAPRDLTRSRYVHPSREVLSRLLVQAAASRQLQRGQVDSTVARSCVTGNQRRRRRSFYATLVPMQGGIGVGSAEMGSAGATTARTE